MKSKKFYGLAKVLFLFLIGLFLQSGNAQEQKNEFWSHVQFGGGIGLSFGNEFFSGTVAPSVIYEFNEQFALGLGA